MILSIDFEEAQAIGILVIIAGAFGYIAFRLIREGGLRVSQTEGYLALESAQTALRHGKNAEVLRLIQKLKRMPAGVLQPPEVPAFIASMCLAIRQPPEALAWIQRALEPADRASPQFAEMIDGFCTRVLSFHIVDLYAEAETLIRQAIDAQPDEMTVKGTLGSILVELGREEDALPLLQTVHSSSTAETDLGITAAYLSAIASRRGSPEESARFRDEALRLLPEHPIVQRVLGIPIDDATSVTTSPNSEGRGLHEK